jgi:hypothetical protein
MGSFDRGLGVIDTDRAGVNSFATGWQSGLQIDSSRPARRMRFGDGLFELAEALPGRRSERKSHTGARDSTTIAMTRQNERTKGA